MSIPLFWYTALRILQMRRTYSRDRSGRFTRTVTDYSGIVLTLWYLAIAALVGQRFWDYWSTLLS